tara:strand:+ start:9893 stop:10336 length:444 start_codon:yes stop_codon:yes gene_type:complete
MKYFFLGFTLFGAIVAASIPKVDLGERIAQNVAKIRNGTIEAQAYSATDKIKSVTVIVDPELMMQNLQRYAYGSRVPQPMTEAQMDTESTIYGIHSDWMSTISSKCPKGKEFLSTELVEHHYTGFSYLQSDRWITSAKNLCDMTEST